MIENHATWSVNEEVKQRLKQRVWLPAYAYGYSPWYGMYPFMTWQEYELEY